MSERFARWGWEWAGGSQHAPSMTPGGTSGQLSPGPLSALERQDGAPRRGQPAPLPWQQPPVGSELCEEPVGSAPASQAEGSQVVQGLRACGRPPE